MRTVLIQKAPHNPDSHADDQPSPNSPKTVVSQCDRNFVLLGGRANAGDQTRNAAKDKQHAKTVEKDRPLGWRCFF